MDMVNINIYKKINKNGIEETEYRYDYTYDKDRHVEYCYNGKYYLFRHGKTSSVKCKYDKDGRLKMNEKKITDIEHKRTCKIFNIQQFKCKECGKIFEHVDNNGCMPILISVYDNEKTIVLDSVHLRYGIVKDEVRNTAIKHRLVFNKEDFSIYLIKNRAFGDKKLYYRSKLGTAGITNLNSYINMNAALRYFGFSDENKLFENLVTEYIVNHYGQEFEFYKKDHERAMSYKADYLYECNFNKISPFLIKEKYKLKDNFSAMFLFRLKSNSYIKTYNDFKGMGIKEISKKLHIPKSIIMDTLLDKEDSKDIEACARRGTIFAMSTFSEYLDTNNVLKILRVKGRGINFYSNGVLVSKSFVNKYIKANSEKKLVNYLIANNGTCLADASKMYLDLRKDKSLKELIDLKGSVKEVHDKLSRLYEKIEIEKQKIKYIKETEKKFKNMEFEGIKYYLAKDTMELVRVGQKMGICVGSYTDYALEGGCIILIGYKDKEPVTCIEIERLNKEYFVRQVKGKYNDQVGLFEKKFLKSFFKKKNVSIKTHDLSIYMANKAEPFLLNEI